jgi:hypothetical protein
LNRRAEGIYVEQTVTRGEVAHDFHGDADGQMGACFAAEVLSAAMAIGYSYHGDSRRSVGPALERILVW